MIAQNQQILPALHYYARLGNRGFSNAAYPLLYIDRRRSRVFYVLDLSTDPQKVMPKGFSEADVKLEEGETRTIALLPISAFSA